MKSVIATTALAVALCAPFITLPVFASGGAATGGGGGGTTTGGGTGSKKAAVPTLYTSAFAAPYYTTGPTGTCTFGYTSDNSYRSLDVSVSGLNYPDGTEIQCEVDMVCPSPVNYYLTTTTVYTCKMAVYGHAAKLYISTASGNTVPDYPIPTAGNTTVYVNTPTGAHLVSATLGQSKQKHTGSAA